MLTKIKPVKVPKPKKRLGRSITARNISNKFKTFFKKNNSQKYSCDIENFTCKLIGAKKSNIGGDFLFNGNVYEFKMRRRQTIDDKIFIRQARLQDNVDFLIFNVIDNFSKSDSLNLHYFILTIDQLAYEIATHRWTPSDGKGELASRDSVGHTFLKGEWERWKRTYHYFQSIEELKTYLLTLPCGNKSNLK